jgi:hypothetical protein
MGGPENGIEAETSCFAMWRSCRKRWFGTRLRRLEVAVDEFDGKQSSDRIEEDLVKR